MNNFEKLEKLAKYITGKKIVYDSKDIFQTVDTIFLKNSFKSNDNFILIHEIGHFLAASEDERKLYNLGLPEESKSDKPELCIIERELDSRDFGNLIFTNWSFHLNDISEFQYVRYLCNDIFVEYEPYISYKKDLEKAELKLKNKLEKLNINLDLINEILND